jgi:hypothetical protein
MVSQAMRISTMTMSWMPIALRVSSLNATVYSLYRTVFLET